MKKLLFVFVFVLFVATGCSSDRKVIPVQFEETIGDLAYVIQLSKNQYGMNDEIEVNAKVTNIGRDTLTYTSGSSSCPIHLSVQIVNQKSSKSLTYKPVDYACTDDLNKSELEPNQTVEQKVVFVPKYYNGSGLESAVPGTYDVLVSLPSEGIDHTEENQPKPKNVRARAKTSIILRGAIS